MMSDYERLLDLAKTQGSGKKSQTPFSTKVLVNKKSPKDKKLSDNVRRFMEKKEQEEKDQASQDQQKRAHLLELRRGNKKSVRTMNSMLMRTKSANKSALAEAFNGRDTADTLAGTKQCDEDDYGYESSIAQKFFEKLVTKYEQNPVDPMDKFTKSGNLKKSKKELSNTMERVKNSLNQGSEESSRSRENGGRSRTRTTAPSTPTPSKPKPVEAAHGKPDKKKLSIEEARRKRLANAARAPPPPSFDDLCKIANTKSKEPVKVDKSKLIRESEFGRPMTKKEKDEFVRERTSHFRKIGKLPRDNASQSQGVEAAGKAPTSGSDKAKSASAHPNVKSKSQSSTNPTPPVPEKKKPEIVGPEFHPAVLKSRKMAPPPGHSTKRPASSAPPRPQSDMSSKAKRPRVERSRSPSPIARSSHGGGHKFRPNRIESDYEDDEEDEESDMDDFIDDNGAGFSVTDEISKIFGYDRRKFRDEEPFDDRSMENNRFSDLMKEEARSARIGLQEDLEDMRKEEEEKKRKKIKKRK